ncbi:MAG: hypothetical protein ACK55I_18855, partial [bacterium]
LFVHRHEGAMPFRLQFLYGHFRLPEDLFETGASREEVHALRIESAVPRHAATERGNHSCKLALHA